MDQALTSRPGWLRLWAVAVLAHVIGNPLFARLDPTVALRLGTLAMTGAATALLLKPTRSALTATNALVLVVAWLEAPILGNHWLLAALVALAMLVAERRPDPWGWFASTAKLMLLGFYLWVAFGKFNRGFFDPVESCSVVYANQWLEGFRLPPVAAIEGFPLFPVATVLIEWSIPLLLLFGRTRVAGVVIGLIFHLVLSFDLAQHFYDFTAVLIPLFVLFLRGSTVSSLDERLGGGQLNPLAIVAGALGVGSAAFDQRVVVLAVTRGAFVLWAIYVIWLASWVWNSRRSGAARLTHPTSAAAWVLIGVVVLNGMTPYLGLKTATSWNMYANLRTAAGDTNHLLVGSSLGGDESLVEILGSSDPGLRAYVGSGLALPEENLRRYLADRPDAVVTYRSAGGVETASGAALGRSAGPIRSKLQFDRAVDATGEDRCQLVWLPAG